MCSKDASNSWILARNATGDTERRRPSRLWSKKTSPILGLHNLPTLKRTILEDQVEVVDGLTGAQKLIFVRVKAWEEGGEKSSQLVSSEPNAPREALQVAHSAICDEPEVSFRRKFAILLQISHGNIWRKNRSVWWGQRVQLFSPARLQLKQQMEMMTMIFIVGKRFLDCGHSTMSSIDRQSQTMKVTMIIICPRLKYSSMPIFLKALSQSMAGFAGFHGASACVMTVFPIADNGEWQKGSLFYVRDRRPGPVRQM